MVFKIGKIGVDKSDEAQKIKEKLHKDSTYIPSKRESKILRKDLENKAKARRQASDSESKEKPTPRTSPNSNKEMAKRRKAKTLTISRSTQDTIPYIADYDEGVFEVSPNQFSKMYRLTDINYQSSKINEQADMFCKYRELVNSFSEDYHFSICIDNRIISEEERENRVLIKMRNDKLDLHRKEYNSVIRKQIVAGRNNIVTEKFLIVTIEADSPIDALVAFHKIDASVAENLRKIGSNGVALTTSERLSYYHDKFRVGCEGELRVDFDKLKTMGISSKDYIAPDGFEFPRNGSYFRIGDTYCRTLFLANVPSTITDNFLCDVCDVNYPLVASVNVKPLSAEKGLKIVKRQLADIEEDKSGAEKRALKAGYSPENIPHNIKDAYVQAEKIYNDVIANDQKLFLVSLTIMVSGNTLTELEENCNLVISKARKVSAQFMTMRYQQEDGMKMTLPFGYVPERVCFDRMLHSEALAALMPFKNQEIFQPGGYFYGLNQSSGNLVVVNRCDMKTPSGFILGTSGSGKTFASKHEMINVFLHDSESCVLVIDPENEYGDFAHAFGGTVIKISADSDYHINPMDMSENYGLDENDDLNMPLELKKEKALRKKSDYIMSIVERMISTGDGPNASTITPTQKTIVDQAVQRCYRNYFEHDFDSKYLPTLQDLQAELDKAKTTADGAAVALGTEYYTRGTMNVFSMPTNVNLDNRLIVFNVRDLGSQLQQIALIIIFDFIWNKMVQNRNKGVRTYCYADEIHVMFRSWYSADFLRQLYKRGRKYGLCITGMTQNVEDLLVSTQARGMIGNSDFIMMLNQNSEDLKLLAGMLSISEQQMSYVKSSDPGEGLIFAERVIVPFHNSFPPDSFLYKLMSSRFAEDLTESEILNMVLNNNNAQ